MRYSALPPSLWFLLGMCAAFLAVPASSYAASFLMDGTRNSSAFRTYAAPEWNAPEYDCNSSTDYPCRSSAPCWVDNSAGTLACGTFFGSTATVAWSSDGFKGRPNVTQATAVMRYRYNPLVFQTQYENVTDVYLQVTSCGAELVSEGGFCVAAPPPPAGCEGVLPDYYSCTGTGASTQAALTQAMECQEGAATSSGCLLEPTPGAAGPVCTNITTTVAQGGTGIPTIKCVFALTPDPLAVLDPNESVPEIDNDDPWDGDTLNESVTETDNGEDCVSTQTVDNSVFEGENGYLTNCRITTVDNVGAGCSVGQTVTQSCTQGFPDGSERHESSNVIRDMLGNIVGQTSGVTNTGPGTIAQQEAEAAEEGSFAGGACGSPPTCSGDPILCGIAQLAYLDACQFSDGMAGGFDADDLYGPSATGSQVEVDLEASMTGITASTGWLGDRSCPVIPPVTIMGQTVTWSFAGICEAFSALSFLVLGFASFAAFRMVAGAV